MGEKTFAPKIWAPGAVRSVVPRAPPFGCHCAAMTFCVLVRDMTKTLNVGRAKAPCPRGQDCQRRVRPKHPRARAREAADASVDPAQAETSCPLGQARRDATVRRAEPATRGRNSPVRTLDTRTKTRARGAPRIPAMRKRALPLAGAFLLAYPAVANATPQPGTLSNKAAIDTVWVVLAALLVFFMQAGFAFLEIGFSRAKNAGTIVAKILTNLSIASIGYWACGFAFAFGAGKLVGHEGFFMSNYGDAAKTFGAMGFSDVAPEAKFFFQFVFAAVSLAIVWGTTLERIKFGVYVAYAIV